jgi:hypothetical protein
MAKEVDTGMDKQEMKKLLMKSKKEPVNFSFGMGADASFALLMLDRIKAPKACEKELTKKFSDAKNTRFGAAEVDTEEDPKKVKFIVNKPISGFGRKLVKTLKGTGFTKVQIVLEDGTSVEDYSEEESEALEAEGDERTQAQIDAGVPTPPPPPPQQAPQQNADQLMRELTELVKRIPQVLAVTPALKDQLTKLATSAQVNLKTNNLTYAKVAIDQLRAALDNAPQGPAQQQQQQQQQTQGGKPPEGAKVTYAKSRLAWLAARKKVESDINTLEAEIVATYEDEGVGQELASAYTSWVGPVLSALDDRLADALDAAANAADAEEREKLVADAKKLIAEYTAFLNDPRIAELDDNPFLPLAIRSTVGGTLSTLAKAIV